MKPMPLNLLLVFCLLLFPLGCATMSDVLADKDKGTVAVYPITQDQAWEISMTVFHWCGADAIEEHRSQGYMLTSKGQDFVSAGSFMGAWIEPFDEQHTKVTVVTKRRVATNLATGLTEATYHRRFAQAVEILKSGQPLPIKPPPMQ